MNGVLGMLSLLRETPLNPEQHEQIRIATSSSKSLLTLINDILDFSKLEAGKLKRRTGHRHWRPHPFTPDHNQPYWQCHKIY